MAKRYQQLDSGLLVPDSWPYDRHRRHSLLSPKEFMFTPGCGCGGGGENDCPCQCELFLDGKAPCCFAVTFSGITNGTCASCATAYNNSPFQLRQDTPGGCTWSCRTNRYCDLSTYTCDQITLSVTFESGLYYVTVTLNSHVWKSSFGDSPPTCTSLGGYLAHITSSGRCNTSAATCRIQPLGNGLDDCVCGYTCSACAGTLPLEIAVTLSGVVSWSDYYPGCPQKQCESVFNGTFIIPLVCPSCTGGITLPGVCTCPPPGYPSYVIQFSELHAGFYGGPPYSFQVSPSTEPCQPETSSPLCAWWPYFRYDFGSTKPSCDWLLTERTIPFGAELSGQYACQLCKFADATCTVVAA